MTIARFSTVEPSGCFTHTVTSRSFTSCFTPAQSTQSLNRRLICASVGGMIGLSLASISQTQMRPPGPSQKASVVCVAIVLYVPRVARAVDRHAPGAVVRVLYLAAPARLHPAAP